MSETSILWLKALIIEMGSCPLVYVWMVIYVKIQLFVGRNTKGNKKEALTLMFWAIFSPGLVIPYGVTLRLGYYHYGEKTDWAYIIWVTILLILYLTPSFFYFYKRWPELKRVGF